MKLTTDNVEAFLLLYAENELDEITRKEVETFLTENPSYRELLADYDPNFRLPEPSTPVYSRKAALLHKVVIPVWVRWVGSAAAVLLLLAGSFAVWYKVGGQTDELRGSSSLVAVTCDSNNTIQMLKNTVISEKKQDAFVLSQEETKLDPIVLEKFHSPHIYSARNADEKLKDGDENLKKESQEILLATSEQQTETKLEMNIMDKSNLLYSADKQKDLPTLERLEKSQANNFTETKDSLDNSVEDALGINQSIHYVKVYSFETDSLSELQEKGSVFVVRLPLPENVRKLGKFIGRLFVGSFEHYPQAGEKLLNLFEKAEMITKPLIPNLMAKQ